MSARPEELAHLHERWEREAVFHDDLAKELDPALPPASDLAHYDDAVFATAGVIAGARVLDVGCGHGDMTLRLLALGAQVTGLDLSAGMVEVARRRVELQANGRTADFVVAPIESTGLPSASFDLVVGRWILHHVELQPAAAELARILAPGGRAVFLENSGANPLLRFARNHVAGRFGVPMFGTADERPLLRDDWQVLEQSFARVRGEFPIFDFFELLDRQIFRYRSQTASSVCAALDRQMARTPLRKYSYRVLVVAQN